MKVIFSKQIHGCFAACSSDDVYLTAELDLPFAPFVGMKITNEKWLEDTIEDVYWDLDHNAFKVYTPSNKEIYEAQLHHENYRPIQEIVDEYLTYGFWKVKNYRKDNDNDTTNS